MKQRRILVVGGLAAGPSAAAKAKRINPQADVSLFEAAETVSYGICEAPYAISGVIKEEPRLVSYTPERLSEEKGIRVRNLHLVDRILPAKKTIVVRDLRRNELIEEKYDRLILATGATPKQLDVEGVDARNVFHLSSREETLNIISYLERERPKEAVIIGGGYIGMEMSEALRCRGLDVTLIHRHRLPMAGLEQSPRERVVETLEQNGGHFVTNARVEALGQVDGRVHHVITNRGTFEAGIVILSLGVEPNVKLARSAKVKLGTTGAIMTDERQQTNIEGIYAAGDCCEVRNIVSGKPMYLPLATIASRAARVAGANAGGGRATFKGAIRAIAVKIFDLEVAQVGISSEEAKAAGFDAVTDTITAFGKIALMPGSQKITVTIIAERRSGRVLGANVYGGSGAVLRANTLGVAIQHKLTVDDMSRLDMIYAPPFAPLWDPILIAANQAKKKINSEML